MRRLLLPILAHLLVLPATLAHLAIDALTHPDPARRGNTAVLLAVGVLLAAAALGVFQD
jgi:hypothetical protein